MQCESPPEPPLSPLYALRHRVSQLLNHYGADTLEARVFRALHIFLVVWGVAGLVLTTDPNWEHGEIALVEIPEFLFVVEFLLRLWTAPEIMGDGFEVPWEARWRWMKTPLGLIDLLGAGLIPALWIVGFPTPVADLGGVVWMFKVARYSQGLAVLGRVILIEAEPLSGVMFAFGVTLLFAAILAHVLERHAQPEQFGTVPKALWWAITTLTTTGYGDVVPSTLAGRVLGGMVMMCGIAVFALWAGILATGFSQEMKRRAFLRTWDMIAHVPLFRDAGAAVITEVAQRLRPREVNAGTVLVRRGDVGDCMFFIVSGLVEVQVKPRPVLFKSGDFFGELSLLTGSRRSATAVTRKATTLLILDVVDFRDLVARHSELSQAIHEEAERRLRQSRRHHDHLKRQGEND